MEIVFYACTIILFIYFQLFIAVILPVLLVTVVILWFRQHKGGKKAKTGMGNGPVAPLFPEGEDVIVNEAATPLPTAQQPFIQKQAVDDLHNQLLFEAFIHARMEGSAFQRTGSDPYSVYTSGAGENKIQICIVCRWKEAFTAGRVEWARSFEMVRYRSYESGTGVPLYIVIGVGRHPQQPELLSFIPLQAVRSNVLTKRQLEEYSRGEMMVGSRLEQ